MDSQGKIVKEAKVTSEPEALVCFFKGLGFPVKRIGLEAGPLSQWLHAGLAQGGFEAVLLETRHVKTALSAMTVKTDRKDARGIAQLLRMGWFQPVHAKSIGSQEIRALLVARKQLLGRLVDVEPLSKLDTKSATSTMASRQRAHSRAPSTAGLCWKTLAAGTGGEPQ
jgi:transposase